ncbi:hypothetical protein [Clostridium manihotivorum]|nr:hypothetical protein [Clostridium manihotivorum]
MKKVILFTAVIASLCVFSAGRNAEAKSWGLTLDSASGWSWADRNWDTKDWSGSSGYVELVHIDDKDSYYMIGRALNSNNEVRSDKVTCKQGDGQKTVNELNMVQGKKYWLEGYNDNFKFSSVWAYGNFGWY